jgi:hypothetical protein
MDEHPLPGLAAIAVNNHVTVHMVFGSHHRDRRLLAVLGSDANNSRCRAGCRTLRCSHAGRAGETPDVSDRLALRPMPWTAADCVVGSSGYAATGASKEEHDEGIPQATGARPTHYASLCSENYALASQPAVCTRAERFFGSCACAPLAPSPIDKRWSLTSPPFPVHTSIDRRWKNADQWNCCLERSIF